MFRTPRQVAHESRVPARPRVVAGGIARRTVRRRCLSANIHTRRCASMRARSQGPARRPRRVALPQERLEPRVRLEAEPCEILEESDLVLRTTADAIVVFQAKQHATAERTRDAPDVDRIDDMSEVEIASGRWREARHGAARPAPPPALRDLDGVEELNRKSRIRDSFSQLPRSVSARRSRA